VVLVYAGEGEERPQIKKIIKGKKLQPYIKFLGGVRHSEMHFLYQVADVVIIPSTYSEGVVEATSIAALESMASGVPVVATRLGGLKEIIEDGKNGLLFSDRDYNALAESILKIVDDKNLGQTLGREGRNSVMERNSLQRGTDRFLELYRRTIEVIHSVF
jgi:glycosyltransferase involved in cell wall biosynthesis